MPEAIQEWFVATRPPKGKRATKPRPYAYTADGTSRAAPSSRERTLVPLDDSSSSDDEPEE